MLPLLSEPTVELVCVRAAPHDPNFSFTVGFTYPYEEDIDYTKGLPRVIRLCDDDGKSVMVPSRYFEQA